MTVAAPSRRRISWDQVPPRVRGAVEGSLGAAVEEAITQHGGLSPGAAVRLRLTNGRKAFVKALGANLHRESVELYRREAATMPHLPEGLPIPRLLDAYDDGEWVALVYDEVDGWHPSTPWRPAELDLVAGALADLGAGLQPTPWPEAPSFAELNDGILRTWKRLADTPPPGLNPWFGKQLASMAQRTDLFEVVQGQALLHADIRSDNILLTSSGEVFFIDWGWTCCGAAWLDAVCFAMTVNAEGGVDTEPFLRDHPLTRAVESSSIDAVLMALAANYWWMSRQPGPEWLPGTRAHQLACAEATLRWLQRRIT